MAGKALASHGASGTVPLDMLSLTTEGRAGCLGFGVGTYTRKKKIQKCPKIRAKPVGSKRPRRCRRAMSDRRRRRDALK